MKVSAEQFFTALAMEDGVTFRDIHTVIGRAGFAASDSDGNEIGRVSVGRDGEYEFHVH